MDPEGFLVYLIFFSLIVDPTGCHTICLRPLWGTSLLVAASGREFNHYKRRCWMCLNDNQTTASSGGIVFCVELWVWYQIFLYHPGIVSPCRIARRTNCTVERWSLNPFIILYGLVVLESFHRIVSYGPIVFESFHWIVSNNPQVFSSCGIVSNRILLKLFSSQPSYYCIIQSRTILSNPVMSCCVLKPFHPCIILYHLGIMLSYCILLLSSISYVFETWCVAFRLFWYEVKTSLL
jgi:hypothetical protein